MAARVGDVLVGVAADGDGAVGRGGEPDHDAHRRGLAGTVGPEEAGDPSRLGDEADVVDGLEAAIGACESVDRDHGPHPSGWRPRRHRPRGWSAATKVGGARTRGRSPRRTRGHLALRLVQPAPQPPVAAAADPVVARLAVRPDPGPVRGRLVRRLARRRPAPGVAVRRRPGVRGGRLRAGAVPAPLAAGRRGGDHAALDGVRRRGRSGHAGVGLAGHPAGGLAGGPDRPARPDLRAGVHGAAAGQR